MIDLTMTEEERKDEYGPESVVMDKPKYPQGLKLHVDPRTFKKLGINEIPELGERMILVATVEVCSLNKDDYYSDGGEVNMGLQIVEMQLGENEPEEEETPMEEKFYGQAE